MGPTRGGGVVGWVSDKTLGAYDGAPMPVFDRVDHTAEPAGAPPDGKPEPVPPLDPIPNARFDLPEGYGPGDEMNVEIPRMTSEAAADKLPNLVYQINVPPFAKKGEQFQVQMLSPMIC